MDIMILVCVIGVLSFWVWSLKQEIADLRGSPRAEHNGTGERASSQAPGTSHIQTWTID